MLKRHLFLIFLLNLTQHMNCQDDEYYILSELEYLKGRIGFCLNYFEYLQVDGIMFGRLTVPNMKIGDTIKLQFFQKPEDFGPNMRFNGSLLPDESPQDVLRKIETGQPILYRVDFAVAYHEPELEKVFINDNELCATILIGSGPRVILEHTLELKNNTLPAFTYNINIPNFQQVLSCGLVDEEISSNLLKPLAEGGDTLLRRGEHPWLTAIYKNQTTGKTFICGGSLITSKIIVTAAHCIQDASPEEIFVELGRYNLTNAAEENTVLREIDDIIVHPEYKTILSFSDADLAILKMREPVSFSRYIKPICLWNEPADESLVVGRTGAVAGWGSDENGRGNTTAATTLPKKLKTNIVTRTECQRSSPVYTAITSPNTLCAGNLGDSSAGGTCEGDSGGGLMIYRHGLWKLRGVISAGLTNQQSCNSQEYTVYCDVAKHISWLDNYIEQQEQPITGPIKDICGKSGTDARTEHPWLAAIYYKTQTGLLFLCTGSLISSRTVLAAGNCLDLDSGKLAQAYLLRVFVGRYDLNSIRESSAATHDVAQMLRNSNFQGGGLLYANDIALLLLKTPVTFTQYAKPICLRGATDEQPEIVGQSATLVSWDKLRLFDETLTVPQSKEVGIVALDQCISAGYNVDGESIGFLCTPSFGNNIDGILMVKREGHWILLGISTANSKLAERYRAAEYRVYTDITRFLPLIEGNML